MDLPALGRILVIFGVVLAATGGILILGSRIPFLGHLPGDVTLERGGLTIFVPLATSIVLSVILTIALNLFARWMGK